MTESVTRRAVTARVQNLPKQPPHSIEAEQSVLGGLMLNNRIWNDLADKLVPEDFYRTDHQLIYRGVCDLIGSGKACDFVTLTEHLRNQARLEEAGGASYIGSLAADTYSIANVVSYAEIVRERSVLRGLIAAGADIGDLGYRPDGREPTDLIDEAEQKVFAIRERGAKGRSSYESVGTVMQRVEKRIELLRNNPKALAGLSTGFTELDKRTQGLHPGDLVIIAARPAMGKCLSADAEIVLDDGSVATIEEVVRRRPGRVGTLRDDFRLARAQPSDHVDDGIKPTFQVTTRLGRRVETTLPHPFLTLDGWKPLAELREGDFVAVPRELPVFGTASMRECEIKLLGYLIGDGGLTGTSPRFTTTNAIIERDFRAAVEAFGGCRVAAVRAASRAPSFTIAANEEQVQSARRMFAANFAGAVAHSGRSLHAVAAAAGVSAAALTYWRQGRQVPQPAALRRVCDVLAITPDDLAPQGVDRARHNVQNPVTRWLGELGLRGCGAGTKIVPAAVFRLPRAQLALFLRCLFGTDGWATVYRSGQSQIGYATIGEKLARQVQHLLLRFGIVAKLRQRWVRYRDSRRPSWQLEITEAHALRRFVEEIGITGKEPAVAAVRAALARRHTRPNLDLVPAGAWKMLERAKGAASWAELARRAGVGDSNVHAHRRGISRPHLEKFGRALGSTQILALSRSDVYWDRIESIRATGEQQVYDLTIPGTHNFIANDVCVHNTTLAMNIAEHIALVDNLPVAFFSMEMSGEQLALRVLSSFGRIHLSNLRSGNLSEAEYDKLVSADALIRKAPLYIDETGALSPMDIRARARRLKAQYDIRLIVVDYLQLMQVPNTRENRTNEVSQITRSLKALAKELGIPIIALSQLSRANEKENRKPKLSDLRDSGGIEQDADLVLFIYREDVTTEEVAARTKAEIIIGKQRSGPTGHFELMFLGQFTKFDNPADQSYGGPT